MTQTDNNLAFDAAGNIVKNIAESLEGLYTFEEKDMINLYG